MMGKNVLTEQHRINLEIRGQLVWAAMALAVGYMYEAEQCGRYLEMAHHVLKKTARFSLDSLDCW